MKISKRNITVEQLRNDPELRNKFFKIHESFPNNIGTVFQYYIDLLLLAGQSKHTLIANHYDLRLFFRYLQEKFPDVKTIEDIKTFHLNNFYIYCQSECNNSTKTLSRKKIYIERFFNVLVEQKVILKEQNPVPESSIIKMKVPTYKGASTFLTKGEVERLLDASLTNPDKFVAYRNCCLFALLYYSGARISELLNLNIDAVDTLLNSKEIHVVGKGNKPRSISIGSKTINNRYLKHLDGYLEKRKEILSKKGLLDTEMALFISEHGRRITTEAVEIHMKKHATLAGIDKKVSPHTLRHSHATFLLMKGVSTRVIQARLGHAQLSTIEYYTHVTKELESKAAEYFE